MSHSQVLPDIEGYLPAAEPEPWKAGSVRLRLNRMSPRQAVAEASKAEPNSRFVYQLAIDSRSDPRYQRAGIAKVFIDHIMKEHTTTSDGRRTWEIPLMGFLSVAGTLTNAISTTPRDAEVLREIASSTSIIDVLDKELPYLIESGAMAVSRRYFACQALMVFVDQRLEPSLVFTEKAARIALSCWLHSTPDSWFWGLVATCVYAVLGGELPGSPPIENYLKVAFKTIDKDVFTSQVNKALKSSQMVGKDLMLQLRMLKVLVLGEGNFQRVMLDSKIHINALLAVKKYLETGVDFSDSEAKDVFIESGAMVQNLYEYSSDVMGTLNHLIQKTPMIEIGIAAFRFANKDNRFTRQATEWMLIFRKIVHLRECNSRDCCDISPVHRTAFIKATSKVLVPIASSVLNTLQEECMEGGTDFYVLSWRHLVSQFGSKDSVRDRYHADKKCCNANCPARDSGSRSARKFTCKRCQSVYYCDRACQTSDWQTHKSECRIFVWQAEHQ